MLKTKIGTERATGALVEVTHQKIIVRMGTIVEAVVVTSGRIVGRNLVSGEIAMSGKVIEDLVDIVGIIKINTTNEMYTANKA